MKFQLQFLRIATLPLATILLIIAVAALCPVRGSAPQGESTAENYVLRKIQEGAVASLDELPKDQRKLSASFIAKLLTGRDPRMKTHGDVWIEAAVISGGLNLVGQDIPYAVRLSFCTFENEVNLRQNHFAKGVSFSYTTFNDSVYFSGATIGYDLIALNCMFQAKSTVFEGMLINRNFRIEGSTFSTVWTSFDQVRVRGVFSLDGSRFQSGEVSFVDMRVEDTFSAKNCQFGYFYSSEDIRLISFRGAHFTDVFLNNSRFYEDSVIDFTRMRADLISFDHVEFQTPSQIIVDQMTFKVLSPVNAGNLQFLLSHYDAEFYTNLETTFRTHGYPDEADKIFIAKKRAERRERCKGFLRQCDRGAWAWSLFQDKLAGYGKSLQNLLVWSLGFLVIGAFVFRNEKGMRTKDKKDAPHYAGRYQAFWYSLDLFLPIIKLGEADVWTPKDDRHWANLYRKVHIIIGSLFVPIGLAAWTGIIK